ncbi:unnamed protein product [Prunus armeniaca]|uniref:Pentatricopeptide repeat-containing protein n=1 Tax=Prunus armeniaca TaxID=36596 RepID=A0A6J5VL91_PRUAR|nr:unnamed protein product [Prunus armeniaca]
MHAYTIKAGFEADSTVGNAVITMYAKCGSIEDANEIFNGMNTRDCVSWNAIISAYALHGEGNRALSLFEDMKEEGFSPDEITLLAVLQACSYTGLWETGLRLFNEMESKYGAKSGIEHFACMVDLLGQSENFSEPIDFINRSPFPDSPMLWRTLVNVCMLFGNLTFGKLAAKCLLELEPREAGLIYLFQICTLEKECLMMLQRKCFPCINSNDRDRVVEARIFTSTNTPVHISAQNSGATSNDLVSCGENFGVDLGFRGFGVLLYPRKARSKKLRTIQSRNKSRDCKISSNLILDCLVAK